MPKLGQARRGSMRSPMPPTQTGRPARQAGTSAPSSAASAHGSLVVDRHPHSAASARSVAAASARAAADTGRGRQVLFEAQRRAAAITRQRGQPAGGPQHQIVVAQAGERRGFRALDRRGDSRVAGAALTRSPISANATRLSSR